MVPTATETILTTILDTLSQGDGQEWIFNITEYQGVLDTTCSSLSLGSGDLVSLRSALLSFACVAEIGSKAQDNDGESYTILYTVSQYNVQESI